MPSEARHAALRLYAFEQSRRECASGEEASGEFLIDQGRLVADNVEGVIVKGSATGWSMKHPLTCCQGSSLS